MHEMSINITSNLFKLIKDAQICENLLTSHICKPINKFLSSEIKIFKLLH